jgi:predicted PilT family ATPase
MDKEKRDREREEKYDKCRGRRVNRDERDSEREEMDMETYDKMSVPNELIGSVLGKGCSKIAEIRQMSGAKIKVSRDSDHDVTPTGQRQIQITGKQGSVILA